MAEGEHKRVILASDGLWDVVSEREAVAVARDNPTVDQVRPRARDQHEIALLFVPNA